MRDVKKKKERKEKPSVREKKNYSQIKMEKKRTARVR
jgi:hypothetical protein